MTAPKRVSPGEGHDLLIIEAHAVEDVAQVIRLFRGVGQAPIWGGGRTILVVLQ